MLEFLQLILFIQNLYKSVPNIPEEYLEILDRFDKILVV